MSEPSFCFHCGRKLSRSVQPGQWPFGAPLVFEVLVDQLGNPHRVHKVCVKDAKLEGLKEPANAT